VSRIALVALLVLSTAACGPQTDRSVTSEVEGLIVDTRSEDGRIRAFTVQSGSELVELWISDDVDYGFGLDHLEYHRAEGLPVRCTVEEREGRLYALVIRDA
jgi:hypothetical protein